LVHYPSISRPRIPGVFPGPSKIQEEFPGGSNFQEFSRRV